MADFKSRKKDIAWIASDCKTPSRREEYVNSMKNVVNSSLKIDIYGKCGNLKIQDFQGGPKLDILVDKAYEEISKDYKLYLSLENSICTDYITEKFFNALKFGVLPITNVDKNTAKFAPPHSYINVNDFKSPEDLMKTLENISQNPELYNSYFWWNEFYNVQTKDQFSNPIEYQCRFCDVLNENGFKSANDYSKFGRYWNQCQRDTL